MSEDYRETKGERRERKLKAKRERIAMHGGGLRQNFMDAALNLARKRLKRTAKRR